MVDTGRKSKLKDEMIEDFVGGGAACVFACRVCLCEARKMIDHSQYVFETTLAFIYFEKIDGNHFERFCRMNWDEGGTFLNVWLLCDDA